MGGDAGWTGERRRKTPKNDDPGGLATLSCFELFTGCSPLRVVGGQKRRHNIWVWSKNPSTGFWSGKWKIPAPKARRMRSPEPHRCSGKFLRKRPARMGPIASPGSGRDRPRPLAASDLWTPPQIIPSGQTAPRRPPCPGCARTRTPPDGARHPSQDKCTTSRGQAGRPAHRARNRCRATAPARRGANTNRRRPVRRRYVPPGAPGFPARKARAFAVRPPGCAQSASSSRQAARYLSCVPLITSAGNCGAGGCWFHLMASRWSRTNCLS